MVPARCGRSYPTQLPPSSSSVQNATVASRCRTKQPLHTVPTSWPPFPPSFVHECAGYGPYAYQYRRHQPRFAATKRATTEAQVMPQGRARLGGRTSSAHRDPRRDSRSGKLLRAGTLDVSVLAARAITRPPDQSACPYSPMWVVTAEAGASGAHLATPRCLVAMQDQFSGAGCHP